MPSRTIIPFSSQHRNKRGIQTCYDIETMEQMEIPSIPPRTQALNALHESEARFVKQYQQQLRHHRFHQSVHKCMVMGVSILVIMGVIVGGVIRTLYSVSSSPIDIKMNPMGGVPLAPPNLSLICNTIHHPTIIERDYHQQCKAICALASCCFPSSTQVDNCYIGNESVCLSYDPCSLITGELAGVATITLDDKNTTNITPSTSNHDVHTNPIDDNNNDNDNNNPIAQACTMDKLSSPGLRATCEKLCDAFTCCFPQTESDENCASNLSCLGWGMSCAVLYENASSFTTVGGSASTTQPPPYSEEDEETDDDGI